ncbi:hypothetical protein B9W64_37885 [Streptomyces sp. CS159]|uniref:hypothetical protein n=1 Tax=Streptomyces sp. CS159 TaxID=1982762 RepID=UPI000B418752|nr:hypothetical protein [Streptomyces sp. CS159]OVZ99567.1 hypothetical protein B9W64_37885 [Streptomyces sp. CS159]
MRKLLGALKPVAYAVALLALAHPDLVPPVLGTLGLIAAAVFAVAGWVLANLSLTLTIGAGILLARAFPNTARNATRWLFRALVASVAVVFPRTA